MKNVIKKFPIYFERFELPKDAKEERIRVFRACKTQKVEKESFLPTYEENNYKHLAGENPENPGLYSLSVYENPKDVKRFADMNGRFQPPYKIAEGITEPKCGLSQRTKERMKGRKPKYKGSHVDWWIYEKAEPHQYFELIEDFNEYLLDHKKGSE